MESGLTTGDLALMDRNSANCGWGDGSFMWIFALLILLFGGNGFGFGGGNPLSQGDLQRAIDLNSIQEGQRDIQARVQEVGSENISQMKDLAYNNLSEIRDVQASIASGFANMQNCCCETLRAIDGVNYNASLNTASINANITAQAQKILDAQTANRMADMQNQINALQLQNVMAGVVRFPMSTTYCGGTNPFYSSCTGNSF